MMLNFVSFVGNFLTEANSRGADTAFSGHANEHFSNSLLNHYVKHLTNHINSGADYESAHQKALDATNLKKYDKKNYADNSDIQNASNHFGDEEMSNMHEDSKKTVNAILDHIKNNYNAKVNSSSHVGKSGPKKIAKETGGQESEADLLLNLQNNKGEKDLAKAYLEHIGTSLKYSKSISSKIKVHSPTVNKLANIIEDHHNLMHGKSSGIMNELDNLGQEGVKAQQSALLPHHDYLSNHFNSLNDKKLTYNPVVDKNGNLTGGNLSQDAVSHIRDSKDKNLRAAYDSMATENLKMKTKMADALHRATSSVLNHPSNDQRSNDIRESLIRNMGNQQKDKLHTFLVSTERAKPKASVYDVGDYFTKDLANNGLTRTKYSGKSTFGVGPLDFALDTRPTTSKNPSTSYPINGVIKTSEIKKTRGDISPEKNVVKKPKKPRSLSVNTTNLETTAEPVSAPTKPLPKPIQTNTVGGLPWKK